MAQQGSYIAYHIQVKNGRVSLKNGFLFGDATDAQLLSDLRRARHALEIRWFTIPAAAPLAGQRIGATGVCQRSGASIVAVLRDSVVISNPEPDTILQPGDGVAVVGTAAQRDAFASLLAPAEIHRSDAVATGPYLNPCLNVER
jgi:uncharacterized transporter YbjL